MSSMFPAFIRKMFSTKVKAKTRRRTRSTFVPGCQQLEARVNPGSADPANVTAVFDAMANSLSVSFQQAIGSKDTPVYGAAFLDPAYPTIGGGIAEYAVTTNGSNVLTLPATTYGLQPGQTVTGTGIPSGATIVSVDSSSQVTMSKAATATSVSTGVSLNFTMVMSGTITSGSHVVTGLPTTSGLFVGQSVTGAGIPIPRLPSNPTQGSSEATTRIASIGGDGHSLTLTTSATASGAISLTFITGLALDGSGMQYVDNVIDNVRVYTQTYSYSPTYQNPFLLSAPPAVCMTLYHNTGSASGFHSVVGDGPGLNTDNSLNNNGNSGEYQIYSGLVDYNLSGKSDAGDDTPVAAMNGTLTNGSTTVTNLSSTSALFVGEYVTGSSLPAGTQVASIVSGSTITLSNAATASGGKSLTFDTVTVAGFRIINGAIDLNHDGAISSADSAKTLASHPMFTGFNVIGGKIDIDGNGKIDSKDTGGSGLDAICSAPTVINAGNQASVSGSIFADTNSDGIMDSGDLAVANRMVYLLDGSGNIIASAITDANGFYRFTGVAAGTYTIAVDLSDFSAGAIATAGTDGGTAGTSGSLTTIGGVTLNAGDAATDYNFLGLIQGAGT